MNVDELLFVAFNGRVAALYKQTGELCWHWIAPKGRGFVSVLVEEEKVYVSVTGYTYCLDARTGSQLWYNPMKGFGFGVTCLATGTQHTDYGLLQEADSEERRRSD